MRSKWSSTAALAAAGDDEDVVDARPARPPRPRTGWPACRRPAASPWAAPWWRAGTGCRDPAAGMTALVTDRWRHGTRASSAPRAVRRQAARPGVGRRRGADGPGMLGTRVGRVLTGTSHPSDVPRRSPEDHACPPTSTAARTAATSSRSSSRSPTTPLTECPTCGGAAAARCSATSASPSRAAASTRPTAAARARARRQVERREHVDATPRPSATPASADKAPPRRTRQLGTSTSGTSVELVGRQGGQQLEDGQRQLAPATAERADHCSHALGPAPMPTLAHDRGLRRVGLYSLLDDVAEVTRRHALRGHRAARSHIGHGRRPARWRSCPATAPTTEYPPHRINYRANVWAMRERRA